MPKVVLLAHIQGDQRAIGPNLQEGAPQTSAAGVSFPKADLQDGPTLG